MNPLNHKIIDETTKKFAGDPEVVKRLLWWLRHGQSCERWFQFEWAYRLESVLETRYPNTYLVGCERDRVDIVVYRRPFRPDFKLYLQEISAGIEIKWCGNWAEASSISETKNDFKKICTDSKYSYPALALSVWLWAIPSQNNNSFYSWISQKIERDNVSRKTLEERLSSLNPHFTTESFPVVTTDNRAFDELEVFCVGVYNDEAKSQ